MFGELFLVPEARFAHLTFKQCLTADVIILLFYFLVIATDQLILVRVTLSHGVGGKVGVEVGVEVSCEVISLIYHLLCRLLLRSMRFHVTSKLVRSAKTEIANGTDMRSSASVYWHVTRKYVITTKCLVMEIIVLM